VNGSNCDCGAERCKTTHAGWCTVYHPKRGTSYTTIPTREEARHMLMPADYEFAYSGVSGEDIWIELVVSGRGIERFWVPVGAQINYYRKKQLP